jgi:hypothetical protein
MSPSGYCECSHNNLPLMYILPRRKKKQEYALHFLRKNRLCLLPSTDTYLTSPWGLALYELKIHHPSVAPCCLPQVYCLSRRRGTWIPSN